jgi:hypothetical protein
MYLVLVVFCLLLADMARDIASTSARILNLLQRQESRLKHRTRDSDAGYNASVDKLRRKEYPATKGMYPRHLVVPVSYTLHPQAPYTWITPAPRCPPSHL